jgi:hypothetical protein
MPCLRRCARSPCSTYCSSTPPRADLRAPRIHGLLTPLVTKPDEKCGLISCWLLHRSCATAAWKRSVPTRGRKLRTPEVAAASSAAGEFELCQSCSVTPDVARTLMSAAFPALAASAEEGRDESRPAGKSACATKTGSYEIPRLQEFGNHRL